MGLGAGVAPLTRHRSAVTGRFVSEDEAAADPERHILDTMRPPPMLRVERMNDHFTKLHLGDGRVVHRFSAADGPHADPHDHPWPFDVKIIDGGYVEEVFDLARPFDPPKVIERRAGDEFRNEAGTIHRIVRLLTPEVWTAVKPHHHERAPGFYRFTDEGVWYRRHDEPEFRKLV